MMHRLNCFAFIIASSFAVAARADEAGDKLFADKILPVLKQHCYECHARDAEEVKGGLLLDTRAGLRAGGDSGAVVVAGDADRSLLIQALRYEEDDRQMPPRGKLEQTIIDDFIKWVADGASDPRKE
jgi:hypothetical protein